VGSFSLEFALFLQLFHPQRKLNKKLFAKSDSTIQYQKGTKKRFQGAKDKLRETQVYPPAFGREAFWLEPVSNFERKFMVT